MHKPRKPRKLKKKKTETPEEDLNLWRAVAQTVEPLKGRDLPPDQFDAAPPAKQPLPPLRPRVTPPPPPPAKP